MRQKFPDATFVAPVVGTGKRLIVGEAPGTDEAAAGQPFVGGSGRVLDVWLKKIKVPRETVSIVNCIQCQPPHNLFPTDNEAKYISKPDAYAAVEQCQRNHVRPLLKARDWQRVDLLGDKALKFVGEKHEGIGKWRGSPIPVPSISPEKPLAVPTIHPAAIMREQRLIPVVLNDLTKSLTPPPERYVLYPSLSEIQAFNATTFAFDLETTIAWDPFILLVGIAATPEDVLVVPWKGHYIGELRRIFRSAKQIIGHNSVQFDLPILQRESIDIPVECLHWDTMLLQHLRFPDLDHDLEFVGSQFSSKPAWKHLKGGSKVASGGGDGRFELYCARDVSVTFEAFNALKSMVEKEGLMDLYHNVSVPVGKICRLMHRTGVKVDNSRIEFVRAKLKEEMAEQEKWLPEQLRAYDKPIKRQIVAPPGTVNAKGKPLKRIKIDATERVVPWRSPTWKQKFLYGTEEPWQLGLPVQLDYKKGTVTTGKIALDKLFNKSKNQAIPALKRLNALDELETTFCSEEMIQKIKRMYPHFNVHGTSSGRLSSSDPNLQNIPEAARCVYVPSHPGWKLIEIDYSQIENRLTAFFAGDKTRLERFDSIPGFSEHKYAASLFVGVPYDEVVKDNDKDAPYGKAKRIVHLSNYGGGAKTISKMYDMDYKETKDLQNKWKSQIPQTIKWQYRTADIAKDQGYLATPFGRKRWFYTSSYFTESLSFLPQSTAADVIFRAMLALMHERIGLALERVQKLVPFVKPLPKPARLLLQVHDALIFEAPSELVPEVIETVQAVMTQPWPELNGFSIPVGITVGCSWGEMEAYKN